MTFDEAKRLIARSFREGRLAHAYIVVGDPRGDAMRFAEWTGQLVLCTGAPPAEAPCGRCRNCLAAAAHTMVDARWIEPEKKSRVFSVDAIREDVVPWASCTSLESGWKIMTFSFADRFNGSSANAFLKTLEEPPQRTLFLLLTADPASMLPTILSRCQRIDLTMGRVPPAEPWRSQAGDILARHSNRTELSAMATAGRFEALLAQIEAVAEEQIREDRRSSALDEDSDTIDARVRAKSREIRNAVFVAIQDWYRDLLVLASGAPDRPLFFEEHRAELAERAAHLTQRQAMDCIGFAESLAAQLNDRNIPVPAALAYWFGRML
jgi:hypothetical protein